MFARSNLFHGVAVFVVLAITALGYWPGLNGPLILDDGPALEVLRALADHGRLTVANLLAERGGWLGPRSVSWFSFWLSWKISPADVWSFKLHNLGLHLVNGVLVFTFANLALRAWVQRIAPANTVDTRTLALLVCALWLMAPIQVSTVLYVVQRMAMLAAFFVLLGLVCYLYARTVCATRPVASRLLIVFAVFICWPLATFSKENGALLPLLLFITEVFVCARFATTHDGPPVRMSRLMGGLAIAIVLAGLARVTFDTSWITNGYVHRDFGVVDRLLTQPRVVVDYLFNVLQLPFGSEPGLFHDEFRISRSVFTPWSTLPALIFVLTTAGICWWQRNTQRALLFYGLLFFLLAHALEAGPFGLEMYFEHRNYLPSLGLWLAAVAALGLLLSRAGSYRRSIGFICVLLVLFNFLSTLERSDRWSNWDRLVESNLQAHPESVRAHAAAAARDLDAGELDSGLGHLRQVSRLGGERVAAAVALKSLIGYCIAGQRPGAETLNGLASLKVLHDDPYTIPTLRWFAQLVEDGRCATLDLGSVAQHLAILALRENAAPYFGYRWMLEDAVGRINAYAGRVADAGNLLVGAKSRAPASARAAIAERLERLPVGAAPALK